MDTKRISYSQYSLWANCPLSWKLRYVDGHKLDDNSINLIFGTSMHEIIQEWLDVLYNKSEVMARTMYLNDKFKEKFTNLFKEHITLNEDGTKTFLSDKQTLVTYYEQGCQILSYIQQNYKKIFPTQDTQLHSIEYELNAEVKPGVVYIGYIDIVTYNTVTGKYVLYDLKTSRTGWDSKTKSDPIKLGQLLLYKTFFAEQMQISEDDISVEFVILKRVLFEGASFPIPRVSKFEPANKTPSMKKNWDRFQKFVHTAFDDEGKYIPKQTANATKESCRWCVYRDRKDLCEFGVK